jgi:hypothetical protein
MADRPESVTGGCRCGAVRYRAEGQPLWVAHCHCESCRRTAGAAFVTYAGFPTARFAYTAGVPKTYRSSPGVTRRFCGDCGTPLTYEWARWPAETHIFVCTADRPELFRPTEHVYVAEQMPWLHLADDLPRHRTTSDQDGGPLPQERS